MAPEPPQFSNKYTMHDYEAAEILLMMSRSGPVNYDLPPAESAPQPRRPGAAKAQQTQMPKVKPEPVRPAISRRTETTTNATTTVTTPAITPVARPKKRKLEEADEDDKVQKVAARLKKRKLKMELAHEVDRLLKAAAKKGKASRRQAYDESNKKASPSEVFARHVKLTLNARSAEKSDYAAFADAVLPDNRPGIDLAQPPLKHAVPEPRRLEDLGDITGLHPREVWLCTQLAITADTYRCQKARFFLGLAIFVEYNYRALKDGEPGFKIWNVGKSQCQLFNNMDVNKSSDLFQAFETWGWVELMGKKDPSTKHWVVSPNYLIRFPEDHRRRLMGEVAAFEAENGGKRLAKVA
ncbi:hypothetical protein A1O1_01953 [Capronia coronata CBS 617.96]|uniref:Uncharacterized protein n=1 Tax=Capronia coronata CBS 617.96 TaxID=1182541 RepID=W9YWB1_9EURO|nr:uncharacterized protein A1O1_01953 [Capronia coronata CBS 617.96]EXJ93561.1 hypothetical protein A1O1_01953 [Capronia coronata CBS 617.96]